jgi:hypothetical protein
VAAPSGAAKGVEFGCFASLIVHLCIRLSAEREFSFCPILKRIRLGSLAAQSKVIDDRRHNRPFEKGMSRARGQQIAICCS